MNAVIGKFKICNEKKNINKSPLCKKNRIKNKNKKSIAEMFNKFFINVGSNLADKILPSTTNFESYLPNIKSAVSDKPLSENKFKDAFFTLKIT